MTMLLKASTNVVRYFMMRLVADGKAATGLTVTTFDLQYTRELTASATKIDGIVGTGGAATHVDNKVFELEATDSPGLYMVCFPDAAFATGVDQVTLNVTYDSTVFTEAQNIQLVAFNPFDAVRMGMTALPNADADAAGGLPISDAGGLDLDAMNTNINDIETDTADMQPKVAKIPLSDGVITWNSTALASINAEADTALTDYDPPTRAEATSDKDEIITDLDDVKGTGFVKDTHSLVDIEAYVDILDDGTSGNAKIATDVAAVLVDTADMQPKLGAPAADISADIAAVKVDTAAILVDTGTTLDGKIDTIDSNVDAVLVDTGTTIPATLGTPAGADMSADTAAVKVDTAAILVDTGTTLDGKIDTIDANVDAILVDTGTTLPALIDDLAVKKNATFSNFEFLMVLTSDHVTPATGLTVTGQRSINGGAFAGVSGTIAEVSNGIYQFDAVAADTNGDVITWRFSSATADDTFVTFKTVA